MLVCNYGPAGNWLGNAVYEQGEPGSNCPTGTSATSAGLCAWKLSNDSCFPWLVLFRQISFGDIRFEDTCKKRWHIFFNPVTIFCGSKKKVSLN